LNSTSFRAGQPCFIRITSIASQLSDVLLTRLLPNLPDRLNIENRQFIVDGFATSGADHPLAGTTEPAKLAARYMLEGSTPPNQITLSFASPTLFHSSGRNVILPFPAFVFGSYFDRWNANADSPLGADVRRFAEESVEISAFRMSTDQVQLNRGSSVTGFTGTCQFRAQNHEQSWLRVLHLLAAFSFWCGTGYKTTMGLGQTQPLTLSAGRRDN
jgi:CRISPR-associated endoribonuclease Cas6